ncbi:TonB-dependent receptor [Phenylobacterium sp.]|uniref:TonB-dependent receptor n=1 Tax=Phenylobacterium sp. TaxID=1871053 RepID=UPI0030F3DB6E
MITAQHRSESLQKTPLAVTAMTAEALDTGAITELSELSGTIPGLYLSAYSTLSPQVFIRGIGSNDDGITSEGAVGVYLDGVYMGRASSAMFDLFDLDRIEVLRGPQGTLYGRNTNGGAVKIETARPGPNLKAGLEFGYGNFNQRSVRGLLSGPLTDNAFAKFSGSYKARDGWTHDSSSGRKLNDEDSLGGRGQLVLTPTESLEATFSLDYLRDRPSSSFKEVVGGTLFGLNSESSDRFTGDYDFENAAIRRDMVGGSATLDWDAGFAHLVSVSGYRKTKIRYTEDYDSTPFPVVHLDVAQDTKQLTQELRLVSTPGESPLEWIAGVYLLTDEGRSHDQFLLPFFELPDEVTHARTRTNSFAAFGELSYRLTEQLKLTAGARYTDETKKLSLQRTFRPQDGAPAINFVPLATAKTSFDNFSPRVVIEYQASSDVLAYASLTKGFKSGGFNNFPADPVAARTFFRPEEITAYEVGLKATTWNGRLRANIAAFTYDYTNLQVFAPIDTGGGVPVVQVTNAAKAKVTGAELELTARPIPSVDLQLNYAYLDATYDRFLFGGLDLSGNRLSRAPRNTLSLNADWRHELERGTVRLHGNYVYSSNVFFTPFNDPDLSTGSYGLVNASAAYESHDGRWTITAYGKNLTDKAYLAHGIDTLATAFDLKIAEIGPPRQFGVSFAWRY